MTSIPQISRSSNTTKFSSFLTNVNRKTQKKIERYEKYATKVKDCGSDTKCSKTKTKNSQGKTIYTQTNTDTQKFNKEKKTEYLLKVLNKLSKYYKKKFIETLDNITSKTIFGNVKPIEEKDINNVKKYLTILKDIYNQNECKATTKLTNDLETLLQKNNYEITVAKLVITNILSSKPDIVNILQPNI